MIPSPIRALLAVLATTITWTAPAGADPVTYRLDAAQSRVAFGYTLNGQTLQGTMPVTDADIALDFDQASASRVRVMLSPGRADAVLPFATAAMKSASVLDAAEYPTIEFVSTEILQQGDSAEVTGEITIRGVTRPLRLEARIYRPRDSTEGDRSRLTVVMKGRIARSEFGADGFADIVGDAIDLDIVARVERSG